MPQQIKVGAQAADKAGMTFGELRTFVQTAMKNDASDDAAVSAQVTFGGKLKRISVAAGGEA